MTAMATQEPPRAASSSPPKLERSDVTAAQTAEDRGFEPRRVLPPNRISSVFPVVTGRSGHDRDSTGLQVSRAGKAGIVTGLPGVRGAYGRAMATHTAQMPVIAGPLPGR